MEKLIYLTPAVVSGLVEAIKRAFGLSEDYCPLLAVILGAVLTIAVVGWSPAVAIEGAILGLSAAGLYDLTKKTAKGAKILNAKLQKR